jgi:bifunctional DNA-binding transcriptional regulator/antitoxin component of YhaV-PrlF toxin-antitoxin module
MTTRATSSRQLAVPNAIADAVGLTSGSIVEWIPTAKKNVVKLFVRGSRAAILKNLRGAGRKYLKPGQHPIAALIAERKSDED